MDPELWELFEAGEGQDEVAAIIRLGQPGLTPTGVRIIAQWGEIATVRMQRGAIIGVRQDAQVASFKAPGPPFGPEVEWDDLELPERVDLSVGPGDERRPPRLDATGRGVVVGCVDWGFDFAHPDFRHPDGSTRILALWDQRGGAHADSPQPYGYGVIYTREAINHALASPDPYTELGYYPADADLGTGSHGTLVASIAAGNGRAGGPLGIAPEADLVFVHNATWGQPQATSAKLGNSVTLLEAIDFITHTAGECPCAINLSMGRTGEQHDGTTLVEQGLDAILRAAPGRVICQSTGNYFTRRLHATGQLRPAEERTFVWEVAQADVTPNEFEVWYAGRDRLEVAICSPDGSGLTQLKLGEREPLTINGQTVGRAYHRATEPNNFDNHIDIFLYAHAPAGDWQVTLIATDVVDGRFHAWIERDATCPNCQSHFRAQDADPTCTTGTICNGLRTIAVGAYNPHRADEPVAPFSSMGPTRDGRLKPDLCAPGVNILGARSAPRDAQSQTALLTRMSGTSFAAPHVTGCVALMLQVAPRPLRIEEVHNLLLANTRQVELRDELPGRVGSGYLDIERAVQAARQAANVGPELVVTNTGLGQRQETAMMNEEQPLDRVEQFEGTATAPQLRVASPWEDWSQGQESASAEAPAPTSAQRDSQQSEYEYALVNLADQMISAGLKSPASSVLLSEVLTQSGLNLNLSHAQSSSTHTPSAAQIFDAFAYPGYEGLRDKLERYLEVIALPREPLDSPLCTGDVLVRRGEAGWGHLALIASPELRSYPELLSQGLTPEILAPGRYAQVLETGAHPHSLADAFARRVVDGHGQLMYDSMILRIRHEAVYAPFATVLGEQVTSQDAEAGDPVPTAPPAVIAGWPLGIDVYSGNNMDAAAFQNLKNRGKLFAIAKSSQGTAPDRWDAQRNFINYYQWIRASGMLRGSYHFFSNRRSAHPVYGGSVADQANTVISLVKRLMPGDLPPSLDLEDEPRLPNGHAVPDGAAPGTGRYPLDQGLQAAEQGYHYRHTVYTNWQVGRDELLADIQDYQNRIEAALGRTPMIYTSHMWADSDMMNNPKVMSQYPLWTVYHGECAGRALDACDLTVIKVGAWGDQWDFLQYAEQGKQVWRLNPYNEPGINVPGIDFNAYHGTIYGLRGLADLGRPGVAIGSGLRAMGLKTILYIAHTEPDGSLHLMTGPQWGDRNLSAGDIPGRGADPVLLAAPDGLYLYFRSGNDLIEATSSGANNGQWMADKIDALPMPIHDPRAVLYGKRRFIVYWGDDDDWHLLTWNAGWSSTGGLLSRAKVRTAQGGRATGQPTVYVTQGVVHVVGRVDLEGHLFDLWLDGATWRHDDITTLARDLSPNMPGATYSPCIYETSTEIGIAFRAVGGDIWIIRRNDHAPTNVTAATRAKPAAGHPTCFVLNNKPHIVYRATDRLIYDLSLDGGVWRVSQVCTAQAASDPVATANGTIALAAVRARDGMMYAAQFDGKLWTCAPTTQATVNPPPSAPGDYPGRKDDTGKTSNTGSIALLSQPRRPGVAEDTPTPSAILVPDKVKVSGLPPITVTPVSGAGGRFEGFFAKPIHERWEPSSNAQIELTGHIEIDDAGTRRKYDPKQDAKEWPAAGAIGSLPVRIVSANGPSSSVLFDTNVRPGEPFVLTANVGVDGYTRSLTLHPQVVFKGGKTISATVVVELVDLDGFLALVEPKEKARPASQTHLEFLASVRKIYQGGPKDPLMGAFDFVLYRHRSISPLVTPGSAEDTRFRLYKDWLYADGEYVDISHVLTGIEGSPKQDPSKDQGIPLPRRPDLLVTWAGDLGSALQHYIEDFWRAIDTGASLDLNEYLTRFASRIDLLGDIDGINVGSVYDPTRTLAENLRTYYGSKSQRRFQEFVANTKDEQGKVELTVVAGKKPPQLSTQARQAIAEHTRQFLIPLLITGRLYRGPDTDKRKLIDEIVDVNSPEMNLVVDYFARFIDEGLAGVRYVPK